MDHFSPSQRELLGSTSKLVVSKKQTSKKSPILLSAPGKINTKFHDEFQLLATGSKTPKVKVGGDYVSLDFIKRTSPDANSRSSTSGSPQHQTKPSPKKKEKPGLIKELRLSKLKRKFDEEDITSTPNLPKIPSLLSSSTPQIASTFQHPMSPPPSLSKKKLSREPSKSSLHFASVSPGSSSTDLSVTTNNKPPASPKKAKPSIPPPSPPSNTLSLSSKYKRKSPEKLTEALNLSGHYSNLLDSMSRPPLESSESQSQQSQFSYTPPSLGFSSDIISSDSRSNSSNSSNSNKPPSTSRMTSTTNNNEQEEEEEEEDIFNFSSIMCSRTPPLLLHSTPGKSLHSQSTSSKPRRESSEQNLPHTQPVDNSENQLGNNKKLSENDSNSSESLPCTQPVISSSQKTNQDRDTAPKDSETQNMRRAPSLTRTSGAENGMKYSPDNYLLDGSPFILAQTQKSRSEYSVSSEEPNADYNELLDSTPYFSQDA